jgi:hypothetical protein
MDNPSSAGLRRLDWGGAGLGSGRCSPPHPDRLHQLVRALVVAPDGSWLASANNGGEERGWDPATGALVTSLHVAGRLFHLGNVSARLRAHGTQATDSRHSGHAARRAGLREHGRRPHAAGGIGPKRTYVETTTRPRSRRRRRRT